MGMLSEKANQNSKFLIIEKGQIVVVRYLDFRFVPSQRDPSVEVVQYKVNQDGKEKFWTNGSGVVMRTMDKIEKGSWIGIHRKPWLSKEGVEDKSKSSYVVFQVDEAGKPLPGQDTGDGKAWDE